MSLGIRSANRKADTHESANSISGRVEAQV
jgi:hypothetical protein